MSIRRCLVLSLGLVAAVAIGCDDNPGGPPPRDAASPVDGGGTDGGAGSTDAGDVGGTDAGRPMLCPPSGPTGAGVGDIAPDVRLMDCDGVEHSLHELCDRPATWIFEFADWCPPCRAFARDQVNEIYARRSVDGAAGWMVISAASDGSAPDAALCAEVRDRYSINMPVLFDPEGRIQSAFNVPSNEINIVLREGAVIDWVGQYSANQVDARIADALAQ